MPKQRKYVMKPLAGIRPFRFEGMDIKALVEKAETETMVAYHIRIPPRTRIPHSYHKEAHEIIHILAGEGEIHLNHKTFQVKPKDSIFIKPKVWHSFSTKKKALTVLAVLAPRADPKTDLYHR